jgi:pimeloyl-ACP methyl ester carboxylesterase
MEKHRDKLEAELARMLEHPTPPFAFKRQAESSATMNTWDRLPQLRVPTLVISGDNDMVIPGTNSKLLASRITGARLHIIAGAGHAFFTEAFEEFATVFLSFVMAHPMSAESI